MLRCRDRTRTATTPVFHLAGGAGTLGVTQVEAASLLGGVDKQTINRWATGARAVPPTVVALLQLIEAIGVKRARKIISKSEPGETT